MGMGEPLLNYDNVVAALRLAMDERGPEPVAAAHHRLDLGRGAAIDQLGADLGVGLAISLHAVRDELRDELVPINRNWNIADAARRLPPLPVARPITFEYVMLQGVNDSDADARELVRLLAAFRPRST